MLKMIQVLGKSLKMFCFGVIPFILVSGGSKCDVNNSIIEIGTCSFNVDGSLSFHIDGAAIFTSSIEEDKDGNKVDKLLLNFTTCGVDQIQKFEFVIANNKKKQHGVPAGVYKIKKLDHLINNFRGVYGFADLAGVSELPYFVKSGDITITENYTDNVGGKLEVQLENANGESLKVKGSFSADLKI